MKRILLVLGFASLLNACSGKSSAPGLVSVQGAGGSTSHTGGRTSHIGGKTSTSTGTNGGTGTSTGGSGTGGTGNTSVGGTGNASTNSTNVGGTSGTDTTTAATGGVNQLALVPVITILTPAATDVPTDIADAGTDAGADTNIGPVLIDTPVEVRCQVSKSTAAGASDILASSVQLSMKPAGGSATLKPGGLVNGTTDTYSADFAIADVPNGSVDFSCAASDQAAPAHSNSATISTFIDHGPIISNALPADSTAFPIKKSVHFEFKVTPQQLVPGDTGAEIGTVSLTVAGVDVPVTPDSKRPGYYTAEVNFGDATKFSQALTGKTPVSISAANIRSNPKPAQVTSNYYIILDGDPPTIAITSPAPTTIIGGQTQLKFTVVDTLSGVDPKMVVVDLGASQAVSYPYIANDPAWTLSTTGSTCTFTFTFDSTKFDKTDSQVTVSISAADLAGNQSTSAIVPYYLDNQPPFVSLDPPNVRLLTPAQNSAYYCSTPFDPLGSAMPNDRSIVNSFEFYRAFAWDMTNGKESQHIFYFSGVDPTSVQLFVQPDPTKRVVYDKSGDGVCDSIDETVKLMSGQPYLDPITEHGTPEDNPPNFTAAPDVSGMPCTLLETNPTNLCLQQASDMTVVVHQVYAGQAANDSAVYGYSVQANSLRCTGLDWDISKFASEGWVCLAALATDGIGNIGISAPIAVCFDDENTSFKPSCATGPRHSRSTETPPTCITDGCIPPSKSPSGSTVNSIGYYLDTNQPDPEPFVIVYRQ